MCTGIELLMGALSAAGTVGSALMAPKPPKPPPLPSKPAPAPIQEDPDVKVGQDDKGDSTQETYYTQDGALTRKAAQTTGTNLGRSGLAL